MNTVSIVAPPKPLLLYGAGPRPAFNCSTTNSAAFFAGTPNGAAAGPERNVTTPILTFCAIAGDPAKAAAAAAATTPHLTNLLLMQPSSSVMVSLRAAPPPPARRGCARSPAAAAW